MKVTNKHNLPEAVYNAVSKVFPPRSGRISVTDLINPPCMRTLKMQHWAELEEDAADRIWLLFGSAIHSVLEGGAPEDSLAEEKMVIHVTDKITIAGRPDIFKSGEVQDYKVVRATSLSHADPEEYAPQLNCYAWMFRKQGFEVSKLSVVRIFRDWSALEARIRRAKGWNYPDVPVDVVKITCWTPEEAELYIQNRIALHLQSPMHPCTDEEKWKRETKYALMGDWRDSAIKVGSDKAALEAYSRTLKNLHKKGKMYIQERPGVPLRCLGQDGKPYCPVAKFCPVWQAEKGQYDTEGKEVEL
jgi:hypothetical protein